MFDNLFGWVGATGSALLLFSVIAIAIVMAIAHLAAAPEARRAIAARRGRGLRAEHV